ncbi:MAG: ribonuclease E/G, partial [Alphaproteobacteria bacterium]|nr:ribonuclease E/G [Alphaproteobacteria bacterium]
EEAEHAAEEAALRAEEDADEDHLDGDEVEVLDRPAGDEADDGEHEDDDAHEPGEDEIERLDDDGAPDEDVAAEKESVGRNRRRRGGSEDQVDALRERRMNLRRRYKIQDVIRRRQVLLVQVVKEERGNKGAALTTYLSLAGRYCVLMPNTSHGGGISRKISNGADRKRLKQIMGDLNLPSSMSCIVRTAGLSRTKTEIKRDFDYLARLWDEIRERTLGSEAPALIYGDSDLVKRAIRDIYNRDIDEVIVEGEEGYKAARSFMKLLMPSHVRRVKNYADTVPLFQRYGAEEQLAAMYHPVVQLKSGGYLVINPTEALVSIDINSGRSTREHNIEQTAYATNLEAAAEIARQLRLRDMAGLIVIDFIDMEANGHVRKVEKAMKEALKNDRARIQVGRISSFGLMEMSRQRLRTGVLEASTRPCPHCEGTGLMRTAASSGLSALRMLEDEAARGRGSRIVLRAGREAAVYVLNRKRGEIGEIEERYGVLIEVLIDDGFEGAKMAVESLGPPPAFRPRPQPVAEPEIDEEELVEEFVDDEDDEESEEEEGEPSAAEPAASRREPRDDEQGQDRGRKRRRRRGRRGGRRRGAEGEELPMSEEGEAPAEAPAEPEAAPEPVADAAAEAPADAPAEAAAEPAAAEAEEKPKARRRPRARRRDEAAPAPEPAPVEAAPADVPAPVDAPAPAATEAPAEPAAEAPAKPKRTRRRKAVEAEAPAPEAPPAEEAAPAPRAANDAADASAPAPADEASGEGSAEEPSGPPRRGWWQRTFGA